MNSFQEIYIINVVCACSVTVAWISVTNPQERSLNQRYASKKFYIQIVHLYVYLFLLEDVKYHIYLLGVQGICDLF